MHFYISHSQSNFLSFSSLPPASLSCSKSITLSLSLHFPRFYQVPLPLSCSNFLYFAYNSSSQWVLNFIYWLTLLSPSYFNFLLPYVPRIFQIPPPHSLTHSHFISPNLSFRLVISVKLSKCYPLHYIPLYLPFFL